MSDNTVTIEEAVQLCLDHYKLARYGESIDIASKILRSNPGNIDAKYIASLCYTKLGNYNHAEELLKECEMVVPNHPEVHYSLGCVYESQGRNQDAINEYGKAVLLDPKHLMALGAIAKIYLNAGNNELAFEYYNKILQIDDRIYAAHNNIGIIYKKLGMYNEALRYVLRAVELHPNGFEQNHNAALIYASIASHKKSIEFYDRAFQLDPNNLPLVMEYAEILNKVCDWDGIKRLEPIIAELKKKQGEDSFAPILTDVEKNEDPKIYLQVAEKYTDSMISPAFKNISKFRFDISRRNKSNKKIRIGYMSSDIKDHPVAHLMRGVFRCHNKDEFEIYLYSFSQKDKSGYKEDIEICCDKFVDVLNVSNYNTAKLIYDDEIDILVDLNGHTGAARTETLYLKPAPVQVNYLGYIGSMGADFIDYIIVDEMVVPPAHQKFYTEKFVYLPDCYQANDNLLEISDEVITKEEEGLPEDKFIFCSFNQTYKVEPVMFDVWMNILKRVPESVLWLYSGSAYRDGLAVDNLMKEAEKRRVDKSRLIFAQGRKIGKHLKRTALADLALDTRLYNGGTVTSQTLWAGVPVLTLQGDHFSSRMASSILNSVGLNKLVTKSLKEYEDMAVDLANNPDKVRSLKEELQANRKNCPLFDTEKFTKNLEKSYKLMWDNYINERSVASFKVE